MLFVREAGPADVDALLELSILSGTGFTSLPEDRRTLGERLSLSERSFLGEAAAEDAWYVVMLEDSKTGGIEGVAAVRGRVGVDRPHFSFRVVTLAQHSPASGTRFDHQALVLVNECSNCSEVGSLFLRPNKRQNGAGTLLARSRFMLIGSAPERFAPTVMSELRGWFDEREVSPFWEGIASKFFRLPFEVADWMIGSTDGQFILDLAPRHPIYLELVEKTARAVIGEVHRHGVPALRMLEREGFASSGLIDIFDGGPTVTCARDNIQTVRSARSYRVQIGEPAAAGQALLSAIAPGKFRATRASAKVEGDSVLLASETADILGVSNGEAVMMCA